VFIKYPFWATAYSYFQVLSEHAVFNVCINVYYLLNSVHRNQLQWKRYARLSLTRSSSVSCWCPNICYLLLVFYFTTLSVAQMPITVAAGSKTWIVFARLDAVIVGLNPTWGMEVCVLLFCVYVVRCVGRGLATGWSPVQGVLPNVYRIRKLKKAAKAQQRAVE
jgi:hypothetical protein